MYQATCPPVPEDSILLIHVKQNQHKLLYELHVCKINQIFGIKQAVFVSDWKILHSLCYWCVVPMRCWK